VRFRPRRFPKFEEVIVSLRSVLSSVLCVLVLAIALLSPASAHINDDPGHVGRHTWRAFIKGAADARYLRLGAKAADADRLDGLDSFAFARRPVTRTKWWSCSASAFTPENENVDYFVSTDGYLRLAGASIPAGVTDFFCPMSLPDGAVVNGMRATFRYTNAAALGRCFLEEVHLTGTAINARSNLGTGSGFYATTRLDGVTPNVSGQPVIAQRLLYPSTVIDNQSYAYMVECDFSEDDPSTVSTDTLGIYGVAVRYQVPEVPTS
jgi:hypothetical protein